MAFYNLPLLFLLAGRNDFLLFLTGWSYGTHPLSPADISLMYPVAQMGRACGHGPGHRALGRVHVAGG
jgi:hypothetical protein